ncbi:MAG: tetratricopeptide repeat protein [Bdellovibrionota bacterium]
MNKNKELAKAQKLLQKNKYKEAVEVYQKIVQHEPSDVRTWMKKGELEARIGMQDEAKQSYETVAKQYTREGFYLKAVAVYKKIFKLDPTSVHYHMQLAELYTKLGLENEAKKNYVIIADYYLKKGMRENYIEILMKMIELDPSNSEYRIRLAENYANFGQLKSAIKEFQVVTASLIKRNDIEGLGLLQEKIMNLDVQDNDIQYAIVSDFLQNNEPKAALVILQKLYHLDNDNPKILKYLGKCFEHLKQPEKAKSVYRELLSVLEARGQDGSQREIQTRLEALEKEFPNAAQKIAKPVVREPVRSDTSVIKRVITTTQSKAPKKPTSSKLSSDIVEKPFLKSAPAASSPKGPQHIRVSPLEPVESPKVVKPKEPIQSMKDIGDIEIDDDFMADLNLQRSSPIEIDQELNLDDLSFEIGDISEAIAAEKTGLESKVVSKKADKKSKKEVSEVSAEFEEISLDLGPEDEFFLEESHASPHDERTKEQDYEDLHSRLDGFTLSSPGLNVDESSLDHFESDVEVSFASSIQSGQKQKEERSSLSMDDVSDLYDFSEGADSSFESFSLDREEEPFARFSLEDQPENASEVKAVRVDDNESSAQVSRSFIDENSLNIREDSQPQMVDEGFSLFDLSEELKQEILQLESRLEESRASYDEEYLSPEEVILEFKKGIAKTVPKDDYQTHYNLGIAYKEMGLLDEAISEFEIAREDPNVQLDASSMIGLCLAAKKEFSKAIKLYEYTLKSLPTIKNVKALGLCYELAECYIGAGRHHEAYALFVKITKIDPAYRDCKKRVRELEFSLGISQGELDPKVENKENVVEISDRKKDKDKISFF